MIYNTTEFTDGIARSLAGSLINHARGSNSLNVERRCWLSLHVQLLSYSQLSMPDTFYTRRTVLLMTHLLHASAQSDFLRATAYML